MQRMASIQRSLNYRVLSIFAPILILAGILGFVAPPDLALTSGASPYNVFHLIFGALGCVVVFYTKQEEYIKIFNVGFGAIDLYQAFASFFDWFPKESFQWKRADDILHVVIGAGLVLVGVLGKRAYSK